MKSSAIIRIIIFSIVIVLLLGILFTGLGVGKLSFNIDLSHNDYITGNGSVSAANIDSIKIEWAAGNIKIVTAKTDTIRFTESYSGSAEHAMVYATSGKTLKICYSKPAIQIGIISTPNKDLTITVPESWTCRELSIDSASTQTDIENLSIQEIDIDSASNTFRISNCKIGQMDIDGASNSVQLTGTLEVLDSDGMSNHIVANLMNTPSSIDLDGMSTVLDITLPAGSGFSAKMDGLSCQFDSDFSYNVINDHYTCGDGLCKIQADGMSCDIYIRKGE